MKPTIHSVWVIGLTGGLALFVSPYLVRSLHWVSFQESAWQFIKLYGFISSLALIAISYTYKKINTRNRGLYGGMSHQIFNKLPNCVWVFSLDNQRLEMSNEAADSIYAVKDRSDPFRSFKSQFFNTRIGIKVLEGENCTFRNIVMIDKLYEPRYVDLFGIPFINRDKEKMVLVMVLDHSEVHRSLDKIRKLSESLQQQNQQLREYSFMNSHKIRSHLTNILGLIQVGEKEISGKALGMLREAAESLDSEIQNMNKLLMEKDLSTKKAEQKEQTIVFVDDDKVQHMINKRILLKVNDKLKLVFFENPYQALGWLEENTADVVLLDINMPEMDGWFFLKLMEEKGIEIDVKMLTSSLDPDDLQKSKSYKQVSGFLIKPLKDENIAEFLAN
ncbi:response regulator [Cyclobacterium jeungdonense]|uniref:Response regulator n=1 Tax=Cyclobacterium jeungdonense TaxID=708087 RepID=A0ABT8C9Q0_9BACT|nr:response regulator [Cyclobacterium jeungdonense]MDN3689240.1 response regulator [Cyclobacterium jeungdonense]